MLTMEDTHAIAEDVISGFHGLLRRDPELVEGFVAAFNRRGEFAGLPEKGGLAGGLEEVLTGLLSSVFTIHEIQLSSSYVEVSDSFVQSFDAAVRKLVSRRPIVLLLFKKHLFRRKCNAEVALKALLRDYVVNAEAYPY